MDCSYTSNRYPELRRPQTRRVDPTRPETYPSFGNDMNCQPPRCCRPTDCSVKCNTNICNTAPRVSSRSSACNTACNSNCSCSKEPGNCNSACNSNDMCNAGCGNLSSGSSNIGSVNVENANVTCPACIIGKCTDTSPECLENYPLGMGYVPWQQWQQTYPLDTALQRGTIFPVLDLPFLMGRCQP